MNGFSRRAFLKGILSLAASTAIPVELIEQVTADLVKLPETIATPKHPAGYFKINGLLVPILNLQIEQPMGDVVQFGKYRIISSPEPSTLCFTTSKELPREWMKHEASFSISDKYLPFELTGKGYFSSCGYDAIVVREMDSFARYDYCLSCEIDQYKPERESCK